MRVNAEQRAFVVASIKLFCAKRLVESHDVALDARQRTEAARSRHCPVDTLRLLMLHRDDEDALQQSVVGMLELFCRRACQRSR